jgi:hypothetical protein
VALALASGCGDGSGLAVGAKDGGASITMADCTWPSCVTDLLATCVPSGECTAQIDKVRGAINACYANGVYVQRAANGAFSMLETCKNGSVLSYSIEEHTQFVSGIPAGMAFTMEDASGVTVATGALTEGSGLAVSCSTAPTFILPVTCDLPSSEGVARPDGGVPPIPCGWPGTCPP